MLCIILVYRRRPLALPDKVFCESAYYRISFYVGFLCVDLKYNEHNQTARRTIFIVSEFKLFSGQ